MGADACGAAALGMADQGASFTRSASRSLALVFLPLAAARVAGPRVPAAPAREARHARLVAARLRKHAQRFAPTRTIWVHNQVIAAGLFKPGLFRSCSSRR